MSRLEELVKKLCPQGVEYKRLGDIAEIVRGNGLQKKDFTESGVGCIHYGQIYTHYGTFATETISYVSKKLAQRLKKVEPGDLIITATSENVEDVCKCVAWLGSEAIVTGGHAMIIKHHQNPKYLSYFFQSSYFFKQKAKMAIGVKVIDVSPQKLEKTLIPIPPLEIQDEIVKILDGFTSRTSELAERLTAELTARKKQYDYYRNKLLSFDNNIVWKPLGDTCFMKAGKAISVESISRIRTDKAPYACFGGNGLRGFVAQFSYNEDCPIIGRQGALCGNIQYAPAKFYATEHAVVVMSKGDYNQRFLYYLLTYMNLNQYKTGGAQPGLSVKKLEKVKAPVPDMKVQERLVEVLDNFDKVCNDLDIELPTEVEARKKQYEYYRDALLTFLEKGSTILTDRQTDRQTISIH